VTSTALEYYKVSRQKQELEKHVRSIPVK